MIDFTPIILGILLAVTALAAWEYYNQISKAHKEYEKARDFVEDIVLSFDRELKRESNRFESMASEVEESQGKADASFRKSEIVEKKIEPFEKKMIDIKQTYQEFFQTFEQAQTENTKTATTFLSGLSGLEGRLKGIEAEQEVLRNKIVGFEDQIQKMTFTLPQEAQIETLLPPILIKRDKALAALTDTELSLLEMVSKEGAKTAPEIKERVNLSREHTARLMKKLYEEGYLEREAGKIPFKYSLKKEMKNLLNKTETNLPNP